MKKGKQEISNHYNFAEYLDYQACWQQLTELYRTMDIMASLEGKNSNLSKLMQGIEAKNRIRLEFSGPDM